MEHRDAIAEVLTGIFATREVDAWVSLIQAAGVPVGKVLTLPEVMNDAQVVHQEMFFDETHPGLGTFTQTGSPFRVNSEPARAHNPAPALGEHTTEVLEQLGADHSEISALGCRGRSGRQIRSSRLIPSGIYSRRRDPRRL